MTKVEAAEILLGGEPFDFCNKCQGRGFTEIGVTSVIDSCKACIPDELDTKMGSGKVLKPQYAQAYAVLGIRPPPARWSVSTATLGFGTNR